MSARWLRIVVPATLVVGAVGIFLWFALGLHVVGQVLVGLAAATAVIVGGRGDENPPGTYGP